jgi:hypothetical protein
MGAGVVAGLRSGDGPLSVRGAPPPSRAPEDPFKTASQKASSGPALERRSLCTSLRSETKGQAGACPDRARAIPCTAWAVTDAMRWVGSRFTGADAVDIENTVVASSGDLAYTVGFERMHVSVDGSPMRDAMLRVTHIYRRIDGEWRALTRENPQQPSSHASTLVTGCSPYL